MVNEAKGKAMSTLNEQQVELMGKFADVLNEVPNFVTDEVAEVPHKSGGSHTYRYLSLATILKAIKPIFAKHGISFTQRVKFSPNGDRQQTGFVETLIFGCGEMMSLSEYPFFVVGDPQANGSAVTYARRYALYAVLGIYPDKDDDGAAGRDYSTATTQAGGDPWALQNTKASPTEINGLMNMAKQKGVKLGVFASQTLNRNITKPDDIMKADVPTLVSALTQLKVVAQ